MKLNLNHPLFEEFDDMSDMEASGGGFSDGSSSGAIAPAEHQAPESSSGGRGFRFAEPNRSGNEREEGGVPPAAPAQSAGLDPQFVLQMLEMLRGQQQQPQGPPQPQMTKEEADQMMKVVKVEPQLVNTLLDPDATPEQKVIALQQYTDRLSEHAATLAGVAARMAVQQLEGKYSPLLADRENQKVERFVDSITKMYPGLSQHKQVVNLVVQQMKQEGYTPGLPGAQGTQLAAMEVAKRVQQLMPMVNPQQPGQSQGGQNNFGGMPQLSGPGGHGGGAPSTSQKANQPNWLDALS